jgi:hypothetical protein
MQAPQTSPVALGSAHCAQRIAASRGSSAAHAAQMGSAAVAAVHKRQCWGSIHWLNFAQQSIMTRAEIDKGACRVDDPKRMI